MLRLPPVENYPSAFFRSYGKPMLVGRLKNGKFSIISAEYLFLLAPIKGLRLTWNGRM